MGGKAQSRCHLGWLNVNNLRHRLLNMMKFENCDRAAECLNKNKQRYIRYKYGRPHLGIIIKNWI